MTKITSVDLTPFYRNTVGIDRLFDRIVNQIDSAAATGNYPPYDIVKVRENQYEIRIAAAGFRQEEIEIQYRENQLIVTGEQKRDDDAEYEYIHRGISARKFTRIFPLADYIEVRTATMKDGILTINLERIVPDALKPRQIEISRQSD